MSKKAAARQKSRHAAVSAILMLCCAVRPHMPAAAPHRRRPGPRPHGMLAAGAAASRHAGRRGRVMPAASQARALGAARGPYCRQTRRRRRARRHAPPLAHPLPRLRRPPLRPLVQLAAFIYKYHTEVGITFPYGYMPGATAVGSPAAQQQLLAQPGALAALLAGGAAAQGASGAGAALPSGLSAAEVSHHLTPGSSGHSPFDLQRYPGFCRKMRVREV